MSGMRKNPFQPQPQHNLASAPAQQAMSAPKRKPGRPRKYVDPSAPMPLAIVPAPPHSTSGVPRRFPRAAQQPPPPPPPPSANAMQRAKKRRAQAQSSRATKKQRKVTPAGIYYYLLNYLSKKSYILERM
jgi:hypothetical protein